MKRGIDISEWQTGLDYTRIAQQIDFVILREGYRQTKDKMFETHVNGFRAAGLPIIGVYHFLYCTSSDGARQEAESCIRNVEKAGLPKTTRIWCDFEYDTVTKAKNKGVSLGKAECNLFTRTFCNTVKAAGYPTGIYTNGDFYANWYDAAIFRDYPLWYAQYGSSKPSKDCLVWQYSEKGRLNYFGENLDMDYWYDEKEELIDDGSKATPATETKTALSEQDCIDKVISLAKGEIGYLEKRTNSSLDSKTGNAGANNYTKYWRDIYPNYQAQPWCAVFISWLFAQCFGIALATKMLGHWPYVYCPALAARTSNYVPKVGSIVIFHRSGDYVHTGLVVAVTSTTISTIEGNTSGASGVIDNGGGVCLKTYKRSALSSLTKYYWPNYKLATGTTGATTGTTASTTTDGRSGYMFEPAEVKLGSTGNSVLLLQEILRARGVKGADGKDLELDRSAGNNTIHALKTYQGQRNLTADGICGKKTWADLIAI